MRTVRKIGRWFLGIVIVAIAAFAGGLYLSPPELLRVASGYSAKIVCSNVFIAGREADQVLKLDVQAPGHWLLRYIDASVDRDAKTVTASLLGVFGRSFAVARDGFGCTLVPDGRLDAVATVPTLDPAPAASDALWPEGKAVQPSQDPSLARILNDPTLIGPQMRAVVVVKNGRIVAERYGDGFAAETPLLGWSMTKSVNAAIVGTLVKTGKLSLDQKHLLGAWKRDGRSDISLADLMAMSSGLAFNEDYGAVSDVTRMLYLEPDMAGFAADKPLVNEIGKVFSYSSGTASIISRIWQNAAGTEALSWPKKTLFDPIGMTSAVLEPDERGTFAGSSYLYATARDWARFGLFILRKGVWNRQEILPTGFVDWMHEEAPASNGRYGKGEVWLKGPGDGTPAGQDPDAGFGLPDDTFWFQGHDGQSVAVIPSKDLVVVRMGLTPAVLHYRPQGLVAAVMKALE
ncbi:serine hydrolase [Mesorhizobium sp. BAC0120]|uniref:serine hydrolase domain-containing protein n=1 Tax=Mesorhizobium sp. BAC0120 TaxID=3090670 RepID=UPI00298C4281|nr:serine hydrolase [Mesorhizobium sp. BAC0120]MDW6020813.1 serine hydrolase [Mesorhizobium sp. BAC0120]